MGRISDSERKELIKKYKNYVIRTLETLPIDDDPECINIYSPLPMSMTECYTTRILHSVINSASFEFAAENNDKALTLCMNAIRSIEEVCTRR